MIPEVSCWTSSSDSGRRIQRNSCNRTINIHSHSALLFNQKIKFLKPFITNNLFHYLLLSCLVRTIPFLYTKMWIPYIQKVEGIFHPILHIIYRLFINYNVRWLKGYWGEPATQCKHCTFVSLISVNQNSKIKFSISFMYLQLNLLKYTTTADKI
jgi:hypothetical protein